MEYPNRKIWIVQYLLLISAVCFISQLYASDDVKFYESFDEDFEGRWIVSEKQEYSGVWKHAKSEGHEDHGLLVSEKARKYAIVKELDENVDLKDGTVVLQYEVRLQNGLECGGAYIKYLRPQDAGWVSKEFDNESPYTIMFGPDKCGATNKVHFILKHKNPKSGKFVEHHLKFPPSVPSDKLTHVYTAILKPDNEVRILVDGEEKKKANFLSADDFEPPLIPSKTIPDPDDEKPEDWDERAKIPDPDATKPDDWDEDAPMEIEDEEAEKPEGWLDDEPEEVDDPEATKPEDWDDEEDGEWEAPKVDNPKCAEAPGCGEWKRPMKRNPAYKGKWHAPLIDNPSYKGIWKPREIDNPEYFEIDRPNFEPIAAIGIEIWTMQDGILFDNILIASSEHVAESYRETEWKSKFTVEKENQKDEESTESDGLKGVKKVVFTYLYKIADLPFLGEHKAKVLDLLEKAEAQANLTIGDLVSIAVILSVLFKLIFGGKKKAANVRAESKKPEVAESSSNQEGLEDKEEKNEDGAAPPRWRTTRRVFSNWRNPILIEVETLLKYRFVNRKLLEEALTHPSYTGSPSYQRLEFIGDKALGLAFSNYVFLRYPGLDPGKLHLLHSANTSNDRFARVAVRHQLHKYLRHNIVAFDEKIREFVVAVGEEDETEIYGGLVKAPKVLADIVESLAAAVYIDSKFDLPAMWVIFRDFLEPMVMLDVLERQPQPITLLFEMCGKDGKQAAIEYWRKEDKIVAVVYVNGEFVTSASSDHKDTAKLHAAKAALRELSYDPGDSMDIDIFGIGDTDIEGAKQKLYGLCGKKKWPKPIYKIQEELGHGNEKRYICSVEIEHSEGVLFVKGKEKPRVKEAENSAASFMLRGLC